MAEPRPDYVLEVEGIVKRFPGVLANDKVSLTLRRGEILALLGENGAGKSTLMNIIYGLYHPDEGTIRLKGREVHFASPREAIHSGIGMVHQHFQLVNVMTVAENVVLGEEADVAHQGQHNALLRLALRWLPSLIVFALITILGLSLGELKYALGGLAIGAAAGLGAAFPPAARLAWGVAWRLALAFLAIWIAVRVESITEVGLTSLALRQKVEIVREKEITGDDGSPVTVEVVERERIEFDWRAEARRSNDAGTGIGGVLDSAQAQIEAYRDKGIPGWLIDAIDSVPPVARELSLVLLLFLLGWHGVHSWRGINRVPGRLRLFDLGAVGSMALFYVVLAWRNVEYVETGVQIGFLALLTAGLGYVVWHTARRRDQSAASPLDGGLDALLDLLDTVGQVRNVRLAAQRVHDLSQQYGLEVDPDAVIEKLPVGAQQRVEIVKALYRHADILILDEPTAVLTPQEGRELFKIMRELAAQGVSIIFITHKLKEVFEVASHIVVMRDGRVVGTTTPAEATEASLAAMMVGREVILQIEKDEAQPGEPVLEVAGLHAYNDRGAKALNGVGFAVHAGEVLGIAGVQGNGQTELVEVLTGLRPLTGGSVKLLGVELQPEVQPEGKLGARAAAFVIDMALVAVLAYALGYFVSYFGESSLKDASTASWVLVGGLVAIIVDALYLLGSWRAGATTLGMALFSLEIADRHDKKPRAWPLLKRYITLLALRLPLGVPALISFAATARHPRQHAWFDERLGLRVIRHARITPRRVKDAGTSHVPEDRQRHGLVKLYSVADNLVLNDYYKPPFAKEPAASDLPGAVLRYGGVVGLVVAGLTALALWVWDRALWTALLDLYDVPAEFREFSVSVKLPTEQANALQWPLILSILLLIGAEMVFGIVAHLVASWTLGRPQVQAVSRRMNRAVQRGWWRLRGRAGDPPEPQGGLLRDQPAIDRHARDLIAEYDIRTPSIVTSGGSLSGGNQQKLIVAREFGRKPRLLIAAQPTRGIDVGSIEFIHRQIIDQRDAGAAVLLVSAELDEIMALSDRIAVMYKGEVIDTLLARDATREQLGLLMAGIHGGGSTG